jgi:hypothetical protein
MLRKSSCVGRVPKNGKDTTRTCTNDEGDTTTRARHECKMYVEEHNGILINDGGATFYTSVNVKEVKID